MTKAIDTSGLGNVYGSTAAVADLDIQVEPGEVYGFLGPNGARETTTIRMRLALQRPISGGPRCSAFIPGGTWSRPQARGLSSGRP